MPFITPEQQRATRLASAKPFEIDGLSMKLKLVKLGARAGADLTEMIAAVQGGKGKQSDLTQFILRNAVAKENGDLLTGEEAGELFEVLPIDKLTEMMNFFKAPSESPVKS